MKEAAVQEGKDLDVGPRFLSPSTMV